AISIEQFFKDYPQLYRFKDDFKKLTIFTDPPVYADLFGIDDLGALSKLQGPEYALIWLEEPAPIAEKVNAGLSEEVFKVALVRATRQKGAIGRLQVSMNPADEEHWTFKRFIEDPSIDEANPLITKAVFFIPPGENEEVSEVSRQAVKSAYKDDPAGYQRYVLGQFAPVYRGKKVTPQYNREIHLSKVPLEPARGLISFAFFDSWQWPSCVLGQITQTGRLIYLDTLRIAGGSDIQTLLDTQVVPLLESPRWRNKPFSWRVGGDFTMGTPDQSNILQSAARKVEAVFKNAIFEKGPPKWEMIRQHLPLVLTKRDYLNQPMIFLSSDNKLLNKGLSGAWHYPTDAQGKVRIRVPEKDEISHFCDAWANSVCVLLPSKLSFITKKRQDQAAIKAR